MQLQRPATALAPGDDDVPARQRQQAHGVAVDVVEEVALHAPGDDGHAAARLAAGRQVLRQAGLVGHALEQRVHRGQPRKAGQQAAAPDQALQSPAPIATGQAQHGTEPIGMRQDPEEERRQPALAHRPPAPLHLAPRDLEQRSELHAGRTRRLARPAAETEIEMTRVGRRRLQPALRHRAHQVQAAARRVHLLAEDAIGGALRQADAAVHARAEHGRRRGIGEAGDGVGGSRHQVRCRRRSGRD